MKENFEKERNGNKLKKISLIFIFWHFVFIVTGQFLDRKWSGRERGGGIGKESGQNWFIFQINSFNGFSFS